MRTVKRNPDVLWREEDEVLAEARQALERGDDDAGELGTSVLFSGGTVLSLNILGTEIWQICQGLSIDEIVAEILTRFEVDEDELRGDVVAFLDDLEQKGFLSYGD